jgi:hypothetical protein
LEHFTIGHAERLQHPVPKNSVPQMNTAKILSRITSSSRQMFQSPQRAVLQQQRKLGRLVRRIQNVRGVVARIHESERIAGFSDKYQSVTIIQHVSESGDRMMRCCRANKASGLHLSKADIGGGELKLSSSHNERIGGGVFASSLDNHLHLV